MARVPRLLAGIGAPDIANAAAFDAYVGPSRELVVDPDRGVIRLHDGVTVGGKQIASEKSKLIVTNLAVTAGSGTLTSANGVLTYEQVGGWVDFRLVLTVTTNGTGATSLKVTLPINQQGAHAFVGGRPADGVPVIGFITGTGVLTIQNLDGTYPGANGRILTISGRYVAA